MPALYFLDIDHAETIFSTGMGVLTTRRGPAVGMVGFLVFLTA
jgi:hypothetical protein